MTGLAFIKRLKFALNFLSNEELNVVTGFFEEKLRSAKNPAEEEQIVKSFGSPEKIALKLKEQYCKEKNLKTLKENNDKNKEMPETEQNNIIVAEQNENKDSKKENDTSNDIDTVSVPDSENAKEDIIDDDIDLIFSKPDTASVQEEIIHTIENEDIKPIYGEKVQHNEESEAIVENEEISAEKLNALEKAEKFSNTFENIEDEIIIDYDENSKTKDVRLDIETDDGSNSATDNESADSDISAQNDIDFNISSDNDDSSKSSEEAENEIKFEDNKDETDVTSENSEEKIKIVNPYVDYEEDSGKNVKKYDFEDSEEASEDPSEYDPEEENEEQEQIKERKKVLGIFQKAFGDNIAITVILSIIISPILLIAFALPFLAFLVAEAFLILLSVVLFLIMTLLAVTGVVEFVYGITTLFTAISIGLLEIGIGLIAFSVFMVLIAFIYEYLFNITPKFIKAVSEFYKSVALKTKNFIWGGLE